MATTVQALSADIDQLFEHYLELLSQYDTLRTTLSSAQAGIQQDIARANFDAERGIRYGEALYDARMQAVRFCGVTEDPETGTAAFTVVDGHTRTSATETSLPGSDSEGGKATESGLEEETQVDETAEKKRNAEQEADQNLNQDAEQEKGTSPAAKPHPRSLDPIRMFGILTPRALRAAQSKAVEMVEQTIPQLVSVDAQMRAVEIKIRRARKHRAKAEAMAAAEATKGMDKLVIKGGISA